MLVLTDLCLRFDGVTALDHVSLTIAPGQLAAVIGPNGAGKTSLFNCICGSYRPQSGQITFQGRDLIPIPAWARARLGIARMFQNLALYDHLSVLDNLMVGRHARYATGLWHDLLRTPTFRAEEVRHRAAVEFLIDFLDLAPYRHAPAAVLPYGILKRVELGRALATDPSLLLLDEPAAGLNHEETEDMARFLLDVQEELSITQILIEHDLRLVLDLADPITVLDFGRTIATGSADQIAVDPAVGRAYTGQDAR